VNKITITPSSESNAETSLNVNFFQPDSTFIAYTCVVRKSLRHLDRTFVWQIALVGTTIAIDGRVAKKKERKKTKNDTQNKKKREYARAQYRTSLLREYIYLWQRDNATTKINKSFVAASSGTVSHSIAFNATSIPNCERQWTLMFRPLRATWTKLRLISSVIDLRDRIAHSEIFIKLYHRHNVQSFFSYVKQKINIYKILYVLFSKSIMLIGIWSKSPLAVHRQNY